MTSKLDTKIFLSAICCVLDADPLEGDREELVVGCVDDADGKMELLWAIAEEAAALVALLMPWCQ